VLCGREPHRADRTMRPPSRPVYRTRARRDGFIGSECGAVAFVQRREASRDDVDRAARTALGGPPASALSAHALPRSARAALGVAPRDRSASAGELGGGPGRRDGHESRHRPFASAPHVRHRHSRLREMPRPPAGRRSDCYDLLTTVGGSSASAIRFSFSPPAQVVPDYRSIDPRTAGFPSSFSALRRMETTVRVVGAGVLTCAPSRERPCRETDCRRSSAPHARTA
jgi:hypothetical protein